VTGPFATLAFRRQVAAPAATVWQAWTAPAARALWAAPAPGVTVDVLTADTRVGGAEVSLCKVAGQPDIRCDVAWLALGEGFSVNSEVISTLGVAQSASLVTTRVAAEGEGAVLDVTVQLSNLAADMAGGYRAGFDAGLANLADVAERMMSIQRIIAAPRDRVWAAWANAGSLPKWWGPDGFSCRTKRIDLRSGGEWVFDMIAPDGTVFPNHHKYRLFEAPRRIDYTLHWGEDGPKHADAWVIFDDLDGTTRITLSMAMATAEEWRNARAFGAEALGQQTLGKLEAAVLRG
jgi:uncharacterized protein YndB with AHSA1/START domain